MSTECSVAALRFLQEGGTALGSARTQQSPVELLYEEVGVPPRERGKASMRIHVTRFHKRWLVATQGAGQLIRP